MELENDMCKYRCPRCNTMNTFSKREHFVWCNYCAVKFVVLNGKLRETRL